MPSFQISSNYAHTGFFWCTFSIFNGIFSFGKNCPFGSCCSLLLWIPSNPATAAGLPTVCVITFQVYIRTELLNPKFCLRWPFYGCFQKKTSSALWGLWGAQVLMFHDRTALQRFVSLSWNNGHIPPHFYVVQSNNISKSHLPSCSLYHI